MNHEHPIYVALEAASEKHGRRLNCSWLCSKTGISVASMSTYTRAVAAPRIDAAVAIVRVLNDIGPVVVTLEDILDPTGAGRRKGVERVKLPVDVTDARKLPSKS